MSLFGTLKLTKIPDFDIYIYIYIYIYNIYICMYVYIYSGYLDLVLELDFGFNARGNCLLSNDGKFGKTITMFDADMTS